MKLHAGTLAALGLGLALAGSAWAEESSRRWTENLKISGYAETYYQAMLIEGSGGHWPQVPGHRVFDIYQNQFRPAGGELILHWTDEAKAGEAKLDLLFGEKNAAALKGYTDLPSLVVGEAQVDASWGPLALNLGKFAGFLGGEGWHSNAESHYSRGLLFAAKPLGHVGLQALWGLPGDLTLGALADNGQDPTSYPLADYAASSDKGAGASLAYAAIKDLHLRAAWYRNPLVVGGGAIRGENFAAAQVGWRALAELGLKAEYLYICRPLGPAGNSSTHGAAFCLDYRSPIAGLDLSGRFEQLNQVDEVQVDDSYTLTARYTQGPLSQLLEYRADASNRYVYPGYRASDAATQIQQTLTYAAIYSF